MYGTILYQIFVGINYFLNIVSTVLFIYCLLSWFVRPGSQVFYTMQRLVEPIVRPFRPLANRLMQRGLMVDVSVLLAVLGIRVIRVLLMQIIYPLLLRL